MVKDDKIHNETIKIYTALIVVGRACDMNMQNL
jgi:hypothetical protein